MKDQVEIGSSKFEIQFMEIKTSAPSFVEPKGDGYLGLYSENQVLEENEKNLLDQLISQKLIKNKVFSIYLGGDDAHIKFGGWDSGAILEGKKPFMFPKITEPLGASFTKLTLGGVDLELNGGLAQTMVFDPSTPYIYLPLPDFTVVKTKINEIFAKFRNIDRTNICDTYDGQCMIENSCNYVRK